MLRGVTKAAEKLGWQVIGFEDGFEGLLPPAKYIVLDQLKTAGIMQQGGTILGTTNRLGGIGEMVTRAVAEGTGKESRCCVLGHLQRGGAPTTLDRLLGTRFGVTAVQLIAERKASENPKTKPNTQNRID